MSCHLCEDQDGTTGCLSPQRTRLLCLSRLYPLESGLGSPCRGFSPFGLPCPALQLLPRRVSVSLPRPQESYGILCDSQGPMALLSHPSSRLCLSPARALSCWGGFSVTFPPAQVSQRARVEPWKPHGLSQGLSKTCSVCPLLSQPVKVCSCPPEL